MKYDFAAIEKKWQKRWEETKPYAAVTGDKRPKFYGLIEFPYPSGQGLHVGHPRPFTAMDIVTRKKRMEGYNVLFPIGFDAFGLPTENYAIKNHIHPAIVTRQNIANFTSQLKMLGYGFDWDELQLSIAKNVWRVRFVYNSQVHLARNSSVRVNNKHRMLNNKLFWYNHFE